MKQILSVMGAALMLASCGPKTPKATVAGVNNVALDTAGLAQFQAYKKQQEFNAMMANYEATKQPVAVAPANGVRTVNRTQYVPVRRSSSSSGRAYTPARRTSSGSMNSVSNNTAMRKRGWSKAAKGAVIGGVAGAGAGAIINKKNRAAGAVIGGVVGAGGGYVIGRGIDKRDGRY